MKWSFKLIRIAGIDVKIHVTFLMLLAWIAWTQYQSTRSAHAVAAGLLSIVLIFSSVVLHEYGHALVARRYGISTADITLLPIGGVARLERLPADPRQELAVAVAGPAVNVVLAAVFFVAVSAFGRLDFPVSHELPGGSMLMQLVWVNVALAVFNMIPAFPMDGGRVLRALLALRLGHARATQLAATVGQGLALVFGLIGLFISPMLVFVALFVWLGAAGEGRSALLTSAMEGLHVELAMVRDIRALAPEHTLGDAVSYVLEGFQQDFPVTVDGRLVGVLTRADLLRALTEHGPGASVQSAMHRDYETAQPGEMLSAAHERLLACDCPALPVIRRDGVVVGLLTHDSVGELLLVQAALRERASART